MLTTKFAAFYEAQRFTAVFKNSAHIISLSVRPRIHSCYLHLSFHIRFSVPRDLFASAFQTNTWYKFLISPTRATC